MRFKCLKKRHLIIVGVFFIALTSIGLLSQNSRNKVCINKHCFSVEIANTKATRKQGLMYRPHLAADAGMLFVFDKTAYHRFWMKNTTVPLDIIFINDAHRIVDIKEHMQPLSEKIVTSKSPARYALEINAGLSQKYDFRVNSLVNLPNIE